MTNKYKKTFFESVPMLLMTIIIIIFILVDRKQKNEIAHWKSQVVSLTEQKENLAKSQNIMVWTMDDSCYKQIKNSVDGILRLKINK